MADAVSEAGNFRGCAVRFSGDRFVVVSRASVGILF